MFKFRWGVESKRERREKILNGVLKYIPPDTEEWIIDKLKEIFWKEWASSQIKMTEDDKKRFIYETIESIKYNDYYDSRKSMEKYHGNGSVFEGSEVDGNEEDPYFND